MDYQKLFTKKNVISIVVLALVLISIPLGAYLAQKTQIFRPKATSLPASFSGVSITESGLTDGQTLGPIKFDFTPVAGKNVGVSMWRGLSSPSQKNCASKETCPAGTFEHFEAAGSDTGAWQAWVLNEKVPFLIEFTNGGTVSYQRTLESVKPQVAVKVLDRTSAVAPAALVAGKEYTIRIDATDNAKSDGPTIQSADVACNTAISSIQISAMSGTTTKDGTWTGSFRESGRCPADGTFTYPTALKAPFYIEYNVADINKNATTGSLTGQVAGSGGTASADCSVSGGQDTLIVGTSGTYTATFTASPNGPFSEIDAYLASNLSFSATLYDQVGGDLKYMNSGTAKSSGSITFTPTQPGTYKIACRSTNGSNKECRAPGISILDVPEGSRATCSANSIKTVTVSAQAAIPNCANLAGPTTLKVGEKGTFSATFNSPDGDLRTDIVVAQNNKFLACEGITTADGCVGKVQQGKTASYSFDWTPTTVGNYDVLCRSWNDFKLECRGDTNYVPTSGSNSNGAPDISRLRVCTGPTSKLTVNVTAPVVTGTVTTTQPPATGTVTTTQPPAAAQIKLSLSVDNVVKRVGDTVLIPITFQTLNQTAQVRVIDFTIKFDPTKFQLADTNGFTPEPGTGLQSTCNTQVLPLCSIGPFPAVGQIRFLTTRTAPASIALTGPFKLGTINLKSIAQTEANTKTRVELTKESVNSLTEEQLVTEKVAVDLEIKEKIFTKQYRVLVLDGILNKAQIAAHTTLPAKIAAQPAFEYKNADGSVEPIKVSGLPLVSAVAPLTFGPKTVLIQFEDYSSPPQTVLFFRTITLNPNPTISQVSCTQSAFDNSTILTIFGSNLGTFDRVKSTVKVSNQLAEISTNGWIPVSQASAALKAQIQEGTNPDSVILATLKNKRVEDVVPIEVKTAEEKAATSSCGIDTSIVSFTAIPQCRSGDLSLTNVSVKIAPLVTIIDRKSVV